MTLVHNLQVPKWPWNSWEGVWTHQAPAGATSLQAHVSAPTCIKWQGNNQHPLGLKHNWKRQLWDCYFFPPALKIYLNKCGREGEFCRLETKYHLELKDEIPRAFACFPQVKEGLEGPDANMLPLSYRHETKTRWKTHSSEKLLKSHAVSLIKCVTFKLIIILRVTATELCLSVLCQSDISPWHANTEARAQADGIWSGDFNRHGQIASGIGLICTTSAQSSCSASGNMRTHTDKYKHSM